MTKYSKAPISEVVLGITFDSPLLQNDNVIFDVLSDLKADYQIITIHAPIPNEEMKDYRLVTGLDINTSGPGLYRLKSGSFMIQIQLNKIYLNWVRGDNEVVGDYPGFSSLLERFKTVINRISGFIKAKDSKVDIFSHIKYFELQYQDRFSWQEYISDLSKLEEVLNLKPPIFSGNMIANNMFITYSIPISSIGGYSKMSMSTSTSHLQKQLIVIDNNLRGNDESKNIDEWFKKSHSLQISFFEELINKKLLAKWK